MAQYYYTVASLPLLFLDTEQFPKIEGFLASVQEAAPKGDFAIISSATLYPSKNPLHPIIEKWWQFESSLRNELVKLRASRLSVDGAPYLVNTVPPYNLIDLINLAREAFLEESPLVGEGILDRGRWAYLDELEFGHYFDLEKLIVYYLKLQILERKALFCRERGLESMQKTYDGILTYDGFLKPVQSI